MVSGRSSDPVTAPMMTSVVSRLLTFTQSRRPGRYGPSAAFATIPSIPAGRLSTNHALAVSSSIVTGETCNGGAQR